MILGGVKAKKNGVEGTPTSYPVVCLLVFHVFFVLFLDTVFFQSPGVGWGFDPRNLDWFLKGDFFTDWDPMGCITINAHHLGEFLFSFSKHPTSKPKGNGWFWWYFCRGRS